MGLIWKEIELTVSASDEACGSPEFPWLASIASRRQGRVLRSGSGLVAIILPGAGIEAEPVLDMQLDAGTRPDACRVGLVPGLRRGNSGQLEELGSLLQHCQVIGIPAASGLQPGERFERCGRLDLRSESVPSATFHLYRGKVAKASLLTSNAPTGFHEGPGDLEAREKWFQKRHDKAD